MREIYFIHFLSNTPLQSLNPFIWREMSSFSCSGQTTQFMLLGRHQVALASLTWVHFPRLMSFNSSPLGQNDAISYTIFADAFLWVKGFIFWLKFHWSMGWGGGWHILDQLHAYQWRHHPQQAIRSPNTGSILVEQMPCCQNDFESRVKIGGHFVSVLMCKYLHVFSKPIWNNNWETNRQSTTH